MTKEKIIGIDLGTTNSQASVLMGGKPTIIPSAEGATVAGKMFPSVVGFTKDGKLLVGEPARRQAISNPEGTIFSAKRQMGTDHTFTVRDKTYTPQQISAFILQKIKRDAEAFLGQSIEKAVVTVPAYFNDNQRTATKDAGKIAGLEIVRLVNEPTAAAMAYGVDKEKENHKILVFDLGGGTLDVTIMEFDQGTFTVLATSGDTQLGGTDMDNALLELLLKEFERDRGIDLKDDVNALQRVREAAEKAKIELSTVMETDINLPYITATDKGPLHLTRKITRAELEKIVDPIVEKCKGPMGAALKDAKLSSKDIDKVILVGGPTRMPIVRKAIEAFSGTEPERGVDPMESVAQGAAIQGGILSGDVKDIVLLDVTPLSLGIETLGGVRTSLVDRNTTIPIKKSQVFSTAEDMQTVVTIHVLQGERPMAKDNVSLGQFNLEGIAPAPRGVPQVEVTFDIDASGVLHVSAKDKGTGKEQKITITASTKLKDDDVDKMVKEASKYEQEDKKRVELVTAKNELDSLVYTAEKTLREVGDKVDEGERKEVEAKMKEAKDVLEGEDLRELTAKKEALQAALQKVGERIYQQANADAKKGGEDKKDDDVVNADFTSDKDSKEKKESS